MAAPNTSIQQVLSEFVIKMTGNLREWINTFSEYERMQLINGSAAQFLGTLYKEFLRDITIIQKKISQEYFEMRCCSLNRKDLEAHYKKMAGKYYPLGGQSNPLLKQVFIASLPEELQPEI
ncbi:polyprotein [Arachis hypogaea]|nr:polyprotein [Arachis hypogaea]